MSSEQPKIGVTIPPAAVSKLFSPAARETLGTLGEVVWAESALPPKGPEAVELLEACDIGVGSWGTVAPDADLLAACPALRLWVHAAGSVKGIVNQLPEGRALTVASCAPAIAANVAEFTVGLLITGLKRAYDNYHANAGNEIERPWLGERAALDQSIVGIVGASQVGRRVIELLRPFGPEVLVYDPYLDKGQASALGVTGVDNLTELCRRCDAVSLHTPSLPATHKMIGAEQLRAMSDQTVLINTSRGNCIDEAALISELEQGRLFALLDVSDPEPAAPDSPLRRLPNVRLSAHIAGGPGPKIGNQVVSDIRAFLSGEPLAMAVTPDMLERIA